MIMKSLFLFIITSLIGGFRPQAFEPEAKICPVVAPSFMVNRTLVPSELLSTTVDKPAWKDMHRPVVDGHKYFYEETILMLQKQLSEKSKDLPARLRPLYKTKEYLKIIVDLQEKLPFLEDKNQAANLRSEHFMLFLSYVEKRSFDQTKVYKEVSLLSQEKTHLGQIPFNALAQDRLRALFNHYFITLHLLAGSSIGGIQAAQHIEGEAYMEENFHQFAMISKELGIMLLDKVELCFQMGRYYNGYKTKEKDQKAKVYFKQTLQTAKGLKKDMGVVYLYLARINYRQGAYTLAEKQFKQYKWDYFNFFSLLNIHALIGPFCCKMQMGVHSLLPPLCLQLGRYIFRSTMLVGFFPLVLVYKYLYFMYVQKGKKKNPFQDEKIYPAEKFQGDVSKIVCSSKGMVAFASQDTICCWDTTKESTDHNVVVYLRISLVDTLKKLYFSSDGMLLLICLPREVYMVEMVNYKQLPISFDIGASFIDIVELSDKQWVILGEKDIALPQEPPQYKRFFYMLDIERANPNKRKKELSSVPMQTVAYDSAVVKEMIPVTTSDIFSLHCDQLRRSMAIVGPHHIYFNNLLYTHPHAMLVVEGYCSRDGLPMELLHTIFLYTWLATLPILENTQNKITTAQFSADSKKLAIGSENRVYIYNIARLKQVKIIFEGYIKGAKEIVQLMWAHDDSLLYVSTKFPLPNDYRTFLFFVPASKKMQTKRAEKGFALPCTLCAFAPHQKKGAFLQSGLGDKELYYATIPSFSKQKIQEEARWISRKWAFLSLLFALCFVESTLYYG